MRALIPPFGSEPDLHDWYAEDWLDDGGLRVNFITSVDGGITVSGRSRGLQTPGDNAVFTALRDLADVVLVASGTAVAEGYQLITSSTQRQDVRRSRGLSDRLPTAVVSRSLDLDPASALFIGGDGAGDGDGDGDGDLVRNRTIVVTCAASDPNRRAALSEVADVIVAGDDTVDLPGARRALELRGLRRILCEGGPSLFAALARAGVVDELDLTTSPALVGPGSARVVAGEPWAGGPVPLRLHRLLEEDGAMFSRYRTGRMAP